MLGLVSFIGEIGYARGVYFGGAEGGFYGRSRFEKACRQKIRLFFLQFFFKNFKNSSKIPLGDAAAATATNSSQQPTMLSNMAHGHGCCMAAA